ncbi:MAG: DUF1631 family protein [Gammaproteobacteria bacterium]|nr:DUF1631 family protein [Gammaproteobacteria bacterium]
MAATVHPLFVPAAPDTAAASAGAADLCRALSSGCVAVLDDLARQMLDSADDALFRMSETATSDVERRQFIDTMRVLRLDRAGFSSAFSQAVAAGFFTATTGAATGDEPDELRLQPTEELEERIAVGNLAARLEGQFGPALQALRSRLDAARADGIRIPDTALTPAGIGAAFATAMAALRAGFEIRLIVCKLFERVLCRDFQQLIAQAMDTLDRHGYRAGIVATPPGRGGALPVMPGVPGVPAAATWPAMPVLPVSSQTRINALLAQLAAGVLPPAGDAALPAAQAPLPALLAELLASTEAARFDPQRANHLDGLLEAALAGRSADAGTAALQQVIAALRSELREQRRLLLRQVRNEVARELEQRIAGRALPAPLLVLLRSGIGPLLALRLLHDGRDSDRFRAADGLLDRVFDSLSAPHPPGEQDQQRRRALLAELREALLGTGMSAARAGQLIDGLPASWAQCDAPPAAAARSASAPTTAPDSPPNLPAPAPALLVRVLIPDTWFRVFDGDRQQTRWLKLASHYPAEDLVRFIGIDDHTQLSLRASRLAADLLDGRSEPVNPSPDSLAALEALRSAAAAASRPDAG